MDPTLQNPNPERKTLPEIRLAAWVAIVAMALLMAAGIKSLVTKPAVITNTETRIVTSDSVIFLQKRCAALEAKCEGIQALADERERVIGMLSQPLQQLTDSMLALQRGSIEQTEAIAAKQIQNAQARQAEDERRLARFNRLMERVEDLPDRSDLAAIYANAPRPQPAVFPEIGLPKPAEKRWDLQLEPFVETGLNQQLQPSLRGGARLWLRKSNR